ncbi:MAG: ferredoxin family protein [Rhodospirillaceae bacterium]|jgi:ferredoxin like protein|nr:ferredoxin family protein [Rhodospirillaceae bacterium]
MSNNVEEKLFQNRYLLDKENTHIRIKNLDLCRTSCSQPCTFSCPAACYEKTEDGNIELMTDGCLECGTCRIICPNNNLEWSYPRGGFGISFKFG